MIAPGSDEAADLAVAAHAIDGGRADDAIALLESLADRGVVGAGIAFDRGLAYAARARAGHGLEGDLGRAAHAFEESLRRDPHDRDARLALDEVRREISHRDVAAGGKAEEMGAEPMWRAIVVAAPGDAWAAMAMASSLAMAAAIALRPRMERGRRLAASTVAIVGFVLACVAAGLGLGARYVRTHVKEAVVIAPHVQATSDDGDRIELLEGTRVDVLEERMTTSRVRTEKGEGWVARSAVRGLPAYRP